MPHSALKKLHIVAIGQWKSDWPQSKVKNWVEEAGGGISFQPKITEDTTHVVIPEKVWKEQGEFIKTVLAAKADDDRDVHVVSYDWLSDSLMARSKKRESPYSFERIQRDLDEAARKAKKERVKIQKALEPRSASGLMAQVFTESTDKYVNDLEKARADRALTEAKRVREESKAEEKLINQKRREAIKLTHLAQVFRRGVSKARNELLSENHHVYMDQSGFFYDVLITKIHFKTNQNQRHALTIYESHLEPHTYAFNCQYSGSNIEAQNNIIATLGSNWPTAFRAFKKIFGEKTGGKWEDRVKDARERYDNEKRLDATPPAEQDFDKVFFVYHPPLYGSRGGDLHDPPLDVSPSAKPRRIEQVPDARERAGSEENEDDMAYMSGANGHGATTPPPETSPEQPVLADTTNRILGDDAFQQLITDHGSMRDGLDFMDGAFDEPFGFGDTTFEEAMRNEVGTGQDFVSETQTQPSSQLPDTQGLNHTQSFSQCQFQDTQDFDQIQPGPQVQDTQVLGITQPQDNLDSGRTQIAEQAHVELMEYVCEEQAKQNQHSAADRELFGEESPTAHTLAGGDEAVGDKVPEPEASVLGKRKGSPDAAANVEDPSPKAAGGRPGGVKSEEPPQIGQEYPPSPKPSTEPTRAP
ncbi:hypothetical protein DOTSEDRAFT_40097 [Dothistroma septosporum NZE10]|uniref:Uncharacterized protein n=1 Tax=Dothistroma septosporum (strain NZE10 / CBS 128990) TaxID=675120 RepID=N1Q0K8_DOTSN|nr:hypothetical protein DOTSEDRAFT_40097 [Dothistroma septosporum NZE10]